MIKFSVTNKMEDLPQLTFVADNVGASEWAGISLVGKVISEKLFFIENEVFMVVRRIWFTKVVPKVEEIGQNTFLITFKSIIERNRVWHCRP